MERTTKTTLVKMIDDNHTTLINNYFYNSHDLRLLVKEKNSTKIIIISYPDNEGIYTHMTVDCDEIEATHFRENFLKFHNDLRVKYIFINGTSSDKDKSEEMWKFGSGSNLIGRYAFQISW